MPKNIKTIHILNDDALNWYECQSDKYQYITNLILKDKMEKEKYISKEEITEIIKDIFKQMIDNIQVKPVISYNDKEELQRIVDRTQAVFGNMKRHNGATLIEEPKE